MIELVRTSQTADGTFGLMTQDGKQIAVTCELPWLDNQPDVSCIPTGVYDCQKYSSDDHPDVWEIMHVPGRSDILIHNGNTVKDSLGCVCVGQMLGDLNGVPAVLNSDKTVNYLRQILPDTFQLTIYNADQLSNVEAIGLTRKAIPFKV